MKLRKLNETGLRAFRRFIEQSYAGGALEAVPDNLLLLSQTSELLTVDIELDPLPGSTTSYDLAVSVDRHLSALPIEEMEGADGRGDPGFWAAVALSYFELLTPGYRSGARKAKVANRYIPETTNFSGVRYYRHLIAGPWRLYREYRDAARPLLIGPAHGASSLYNTVTDSAFYSQTRCIVEAIGLLYFDRKKGRLKGKYNDRQTPGALPRFLAVVDQFDLTFDLLSLDGAGLVELLPPEFDVWKRG